jgi:hypothetical protein
LKTGLPGQKWFRFAAVSQKNRKTAKKTYAGAQTKPFGRWRIKASRIFMLLNVTTMIALYLLSMAVFFVLFFRLAVKSQAIHYTTGKPTVQLL